MIMKYTDVPNLEKISKEPDNQIIIFSDGEINQDGFIINKIELLEYIESTRDNSQIYSTITALINTDHGQIEILYDEGLLGNNALQDSANMLIQNLGLSGLILRSLISLKNNIGEN